MSPLIEKSAISSRDAAVTLAAQVSS